MTAPVSDDALIAELRRFVGFVPAADRLAELLAERTAILSGAGSIVSTVTDAAEQSLAVALERERGLREEVRELQATNRRIAVESVQALVALLADAERMRVAARDLLDAGVDLAQRCVTPPGMDETRAVNELIGLFDGPFQRTLDAAIAKGGAG